MTLRRATNKGAPAPVEAFKRHGVDFIVRDKIEDLVAAMNKLAGNDLLKLDEIRMQIEARDREIANPYVKDAQVMNIHNARRYIGDKLIRTASPHRILDPAQGPLIAVKLNILTRKTLGGFETDLDSRVFGSDGQIIPGLYAVGEAAGFGGGGVHGYRSLEGTFLGGCLFSGRNAGPRRGERRWDRSWERWMRIARAPLRRSPQPSAASAETIDVERHEAVLHRATAGEEAGAARDRAARQDPERRRHDRRGRRGRRSQSARAWPWCFPTASTMPGPMRGRRQDLRCVDRPQGTDDVAFIAKLVEKLVADGTADPKRVYVTGISNGGAMVMTLVCARADLFAAGASVIMNLTDETAVTCHPSRPLPMLIMNGTADPLIPYEGGRGSSYFAADGFWSTEKTVAFWRKLNGCESDDASVTDLPDKAPADQSTVTRITSRCPAGHDVVLYRINEGGHRMPGICAGCPLPEGRNRLARTTERATSTAPRRSGHSSASFRERAHASRDAACVARGGTAAGRCARQGRHSHRRSRK